MVAVSVAGARASAWTDGVRVDLLDEMGSVALDIVGQPSSAPTCAATPDRIARALDILLPIFPTHPTVRLRACSGCRTRCGPRCDGRG